MDTYHSTDPWFNDKTMEDVLEYQIKLDSEMIKYL